MKKILVVKTGSTFADIALRSGDFEDWIMAGTGVDPGRFAVIDVVRGDALPPRGFAGILVTGSHAMVTDRSEWSERVAAWLRNMAQAGVLILGICYGHQLLAQSLGGKAGDNPLGREFGTAEIRLHPSAENDPLFKGLPTRIDAHVCHTQSALALPPRAIILASSPRDPHQAFRIGKSAWGVQFHPEFNEDIEKEYIERHKDILAGEKQDPDALLKTVRPTPHSAALLARFVEIADGSQDITCLENPGTSSQTHQV